MTRADLLLSQDIKNILNNGTLDQNPRPKYKDGTPAHTLFVNHVIRQYRLDKGEFPICTLRPQAWKSAIKEILWIYKEQTSSLDVLRDKYNIQYWNEWESKDRPGTIGQRYGATVKKHNLLNNLINDIKNDPYGRRHILSLWQEEDFKETLSLISEVHYDSLFTFIFSPRPGTPAASMEDPTPKEEKNRRFDELCALQNSISESIHNGYVGKTLRCLVDGKDKDLLTARTEGGRLVRFCGDENLIGTFKDITITGATTWSLTGKLPE